MLSKATKFDMGGGVTVEIRRDRSDDRWTVCGPRGMMNLDGEWEWEPLPSSRTDEFLARTRFGLEVAWAMAKHSLQDDPIPG